MECFPTSTSGNSIFKVSISDTRGAVVCTKWIGAIVGERAGFRFYSNCLRRTDVICQELHVKIWPNNFAYCKCFCECTHFKRPFHWRRTTWLCAAKWMWPCLRQGCTNMGKVGGSCSDVVVCNSVCSSSTSVSLFVSVFLFHVFFITCLFLLLFKFVPFISVYLVLLCFFVPFYIYAFFYVTCFLSFYCFSLSFLFSVYLALFYFYNFLGLLTDFLSSLFAPSFSSLLFFYIFSSIHYLYIFLLSATFPQCLFLPVLTVSFPPLLFHFSLFIPIFLPVIFALLDEEVERTTSHHLCSLSTTDTTWRLEVMEFWASRYSAQPEAPNDMQHWPPTHQYRTTYQRYSVVACRMDLIRTNKCTFQNCFRISVWSP